MADFIWCPAEVAVAVVSVVSVVGGGVAAVVSTVPVTNADAASPETRASAVPSIVMNAMHPLSSCSRKWQ